MKKPKTFVLKCKSCGLTYLSGRYEGKYCGPRCELKIEEKKKNEVLEQMTEVIEREFCSQIRGDTATRGLD